MSDKTALPKDDWLAIAYRLTHSDRESQYGHASVNVLRIAADWTMYLRQRGKLRSAEVISPIDICWMMVGMKRARSQHHFNADNPIDSMGYLELISRITENAKAVAEIMGCEIKDGQAAAVEFFDGLTLEGMLRYIETVLELGGNPNEE